MISILHALDDVVVIVPFIDNERVERLHSILRVRTKLPFTFIGIHDSIRVGYVSCVNSVFALLRKASLVVYSAEDAFPCRHWLEISKNSLIDSGMGLLAFNDGKWHGALASFGMVSTFWVRDLYYPGLFHAGYKSHAADNELTMLAKAKGKLIYNPNAVMLEVDYTKDFTPKHNVADLDLLCQRVRTGFAGLCDPVILSSLYPSFFTSRVATSRLNDPSER